MEPHINSNIVKSSLKAGDVVSDEESGELITITDQMIEEAYQVQGVLTSGLILIASAIAKMKNQRLYVALGFKSFKTYCAEALPFSVRQAYSYCLIGEKVTGLLGDEALPHPEVESLGITKLKLIANHSDQELERLVTDGVIKIDDTELSVQEIQNESIKKLSQRLKTQAEKLDRAKVIEERNNTLKLENDTMKSELQILREFKKQHQEKVESNSENNSLINESWSLLSRFFTCLKQLNTDVMTDDTKAQVAMLFSQITEQTDRVKTREDIRQLLTEMAL